MPCSRQNGKARTPGGASKVPAEVGLSRRGGLKPAEGFVAEVLEGGGQVAVVEKLHEGTFGGVDAGGDEGDGAAVEDDGSALGREGVAAGFDAAGAGSGFAASGGAADGEELWNAEFGVDVQGEGLEGAVGAEELGEAAAGSVVGGEEVGR